MIRLSENAREAIKTALAMVIVHWVAMSMGWMKPYWAGLAVMVVSLPTAGQSLNKGAERLFGTIPGCVLALFFSGLFPQERWLFILAVSLYVGFATYKMTGTKHTYFWKMTAMVCLIVAQVGVTSSAHVFQQAWLRTVETGLGVVVYTLLAVFLWPRSNRGALRSIGARLLSTQAQLYEACRDGATDDAAREKIAGLQAQQIQLIGQLRTAQGAAQAESYDVQRHRQDWQDLLGQSSALMATFDRWQVSLAEIRRVDLAIPLGRVMPNLAVLDAELAARFEQIQRMAADDPPTRVPQEVDLSVDPEATRALTHFDRAVVATARHEMRRIEAITRAQFETVRLLAGVPLPDGVAVAPKPQQHQAPAARDRTVLDPDRVTAAVMVMASIWVAFLIWVYFNPPGHMGWVQAVPIFAFIVAMMPQFRITGLGKLMGIVFPAGLMIYVFVLPRLSGFAELGALIFVYMFLICWYFKGPVRSLGMAGFLIMCPIQNDQSFNFAVQANSLVFMELAVLLVFALSLILGSPRPEKQFLHLLARFFRRAEQLVPGRSKPSTGYRGWPRRWRLAYYRQDLSTLPQKLAVWGKFVDHEKFPGSTPQQVSRLVASVQNLAYRMNEVIDLGDVGGLDADTRERLDDVRVWSTEVARQFESWAGSPEILPAGDLGEMLSARLSRLESRIEQVVDGMDENRLREVDGEGFYSLLGSFRNVSNALVAYAGAAGELGLASWREEKF